MTAMNAFLSPEAVHLATDGAVYLRDGRTVGAMQKVAILAHLPAILAVRGSASMLGVLAAHSTACSTFDAMALRFGALCRGAYNELVAMAEAYGESVDFDRVEILASGYSAARDRLETYLIVTHADEGVEPWRAYLQENTANVYAPSTPELCDEFQALGSEPNQGVAEASIL